MLRTFLRTLALLTLLAAFALPARSDDAALQKAIAVARERVYPALVNISCVTRAFSGGRAQRFPSLGSGVVVTAEGHVVTNFHVIDGATRVTCQLPTGEKIPADILTPDAPADLAVLRLRLSEREDPSKPLPFASIGDSDRLIVGDHVLAMGNPRGLSSSVTLGIVSNTERVFTNFTGDSMEVLDLGEGELTGLFNRWLQHDALIQPGNSGGPLVNLAGEVVGINTRGGGGVAFAIPASIVKKTLKAALDVGEVRRGWWGVNFVPTTPMGMKTGALVTAALPEGAAAKAGVKPGDILLEIDGRPVVVNGFEDVPPLYAAVADLPLGQPTTVTVLRGGEKVSLSVSTERMERFLADERVWGDWGISARPITSPMAWARRYPDTHGIVVSTLRPGHPADVAKPKLQPGDVVLAIAGEPVTDEASFEALVRKHAGKKAVGVRFRRDRQDMITVLDLETKPTKGGGQELPRPWLGVQTQVLTPTVAEALGLKGTQGFRISRVLPGGPGAKAGLQPADVITHVDGEALKASQEQDGEILRRKIEDMDVGADARISILRAGAKQDIVVSLDEAPETAADADKAKDEVLEFAVRELTYMDYVEHTDKAPPAKGEASELAGLVVADVAAGGWANMNGLQAGDILLSYHDQPTTTIAQFKEAVKKTADARPKVVKLFVRRERGTSFVFVLPDWPAR